MEVDNEPTSKVTQLMCQKDYAYIINRVGEFTHTTATIKNMKYFKLVKL